MSKAPVDKRILRIHIGIAIAVYALDQITKFLIQFTIAPHDSVYVTNFLNLTLVFNEGVAFGMFSESALGANSLFLIINIFIAAFLALSLWLIKEQRSQTTTAIWLILAGAAGNITDRIIHGHVIDFIDFHVGSWHYATFNIADSFITIGAIVLVLEIFKIKILFRSRPKAKP